MPEQLDTGDYKPYKEWIGRKTAALRRPLLDCGHPNAGEVYFHALCDRLSCSDECANTEHDCSAYGGAKDGTEEVSEPAEAAFELTGSNAPEPASFNPHTGQVTWTQNSASPWVSFADVAAGPVAGADAAVDVRRRVQDGTAPAPDRVTEAFRAEVLRQGLAEYEDDGVRWVYADGAWLVEALRSERCSDRLDSFFGDVRYCGRPVGHGGMHQDGTASWSKPEDFAEPVSPLVDAAPDPDPSPTRSKLSELAAALRARARRGGTR